MKRNPIIRRAIIFLILVATIGCDQVSKNIVRQRIGDDQEIALLRNHLTLTKIENYGAFLSIGTALPSTVKILLLNILPVFALAFALVFLFAKQNLPVWTFVGICFIIGGGIGNLFDRIIYGSVTDFLHIRFGGFQTGIFNLADVAIMTGMSMILIHRLFGKLWTDRASFRSSGKAH